jgi:magnesium-transporting ATPase (P-type)
MSAPSLPSAELMPGFQYYLPYETTDNPVAIGILSFFSFIILYNTLVPISLYVSVELIRLVFDNMMRCFAAWQTHEGGLL